MELKYIREEYPVESIIEAMKEGNHKKAKVKLGQLRGNPDEFIKLFNYLTSRGKLDGAKLKIKSVRAKIDCLKCDWKGDPKILPNSVICPRCLSENIKILKGHEFHMTF